MTIPSSRSLIFEVKSTGNELAFIRGLTLRKTLDVFGRLRTSSEDFGLLGESSQMIVSSSKIPALPSLFQALCQWRIEKVGRLSDEWGLVGSRSLLIPLVARSRFRSSSLTESLEQAKHSQDKNLTLISQKKLAGIKWVGFISHFMVF